MYLSDKNYVLTLHATGCPNKYPYIDWWMTQTKTTVFQDMMTHCTLVKDGNADSVQITQCCGTTNCSPTTCTEQYQWRNGIMLLILI